MGDDLGPCRTRDRRRAVAGPVVDHQDVGREPGDLGRDLGEHAGQARGLVEGRDADEDPAPWRILAPRLELGGRQRPDETAQALVGAVGAAQRHEDEDEAPCDRHDEDGHQAAEWLALEPQDALNGPHEVGDGRDRAEGRPDRDEQDPGESAAVPGPSQPPHTGQDEDDRDDEARDAQQAQVERCGQRITSGERRHRATRPHTGAGVRRRRIGRECSRLRGGGTPRR